MNYINQQVPTLRRVGEGIPLQTFAEKTKLHFELKKIGLLVDQLLQLQNIENF